ncbi:MarR family transcriptional regulator [Hellea sp.]|nr:MarR family transcriptional regulator [Hellea sp.]
MFKAEKTNFTDDTRPTSKAIPTQNADLTFLSLSEGISDDYAHIIKTHVIPTISEFRDLKLREIRVLSYIQDQHEPCTLAQIAANLRYDPATVTRAAAKLVDAKIVKRENNKSDTRSSVLKLTNKGRKLVSLYNQRVKTGFANVENMLFRSMSESEKSEFLAVIYKISKRAEIMRDYFETLQEFDGIELRQKMSVSLRAVS